MAMKLGNSSLYTSIGRYETRLTVRLRQQLDRLPAMNNDRKFIRSFIERLEKIDLPLVFNPYRDHCAVCDKPNAPLIRKKNLNLWLTSMLQTPCKQFWVGRDLGYLGGRRTGLPFVDDEAVENSSQNFQGIRVQRATRGIVQKERSARAIWSVVREFEDSIMLWNVFPFHPHIVDNSLSNRQHNKHERNVGRPFLEDLMKRMQPDTVVAIGRDAESILTDMGRAPHYVRHPSYGGQRLFLEGISKVRALSQF